MLIKLFICQSRDGEPVIRVLTEEPIQVVDNHFPQPLGKLDLLRAPEHFPTPVQRFTLGDMSVVWYMYGGSDFQAGKQICL